MVSEPHCHLHMLLFLQTSDNLGKVQLVNSLWRSQFVTTSITCSLRFVWSYYRIEFLLNATFLMVDQLSPDLYRPPACNHKNGQYIDDQPTSPSTSVRRITGNPNQHLSVESAGFRLIFGIQPQPLTCFYEVEHHSNIINSTK